MFLVVIAPVNTLVPAAILTVEMKLTSPVVIEPGELKYIEDVSLPPLPVIVPVTRLPVPPAPAMMLILPGTPDEAPPVVVKLPVVIAP